MKKLLLLLLAIALPAAAQITNVNIGTTPNDQTGDTLRVAMIKLNWNDNYLLNAIAELTAPDSGITASTATNIAAYQAYIATNDLNTALLAWIATKQPTNFNLTIWAGRTTNEFYLASNPAGYVTLAVLQAATNGTYTVLHQEKIDATNAIYARLITAITAATNNLDAAKVLYGTLPLARLSGITSNQIAAATDAVYRQDNVGVSSAELAHATNNLSAQRLVDGIVPLDRMSGITSNQIDSATDAAYRATGGTVTADPPFVVSAGDYLFTDSIGTPDQWLTEAGAMKFRNVVEATTYEASAGYKGLLRANSGYGTTWLYDHGGGAAVATYDGTTIAASSGKKWGGDGSGLTGIGWSTASQWTSNALSRVLPNGNGYFGGGAVNISDEGVFAPLFSGSGAQLSNLNANHLTNGTVPLARLSGITSNQVASSTDAIYRNTPRVLAGTNVSVTTGTDSSGHTTYTVNSSGSSITGTNGYSDIMYSADGTIQWFGLGSGFVGMGLLNTPGGKINFYSDSTVAVDGILNVDDGFTTPYIKSGSYIMDDGSTEHTGITETKTIYARNSDNSGAVTHTVVIKGGIITSWTTSP